MYSLRIDRKLLNKAKKEVKKKLLFCNTLKNVKIKNIYKFYLIAILSVINIKYLYIMKILYYYF